jgi:3-hydroxypropionate dehydrogenase (NADP+)
MNITKVACVGVGLIGHSWATLFSLKDLEINIYDISDEYLKKAYKKIEENLKFLEKEKIIEKGKISESLSKIKKTTNFIEAIKDVDYVQESIPENYVTKRDIYKKMDSYAPKNAILASSTSGLLMSNIQKVTKRPSRCIIAHPCTPPHIIPLIEIVPGQKTSKNTVKTTYDFMVKNGKTPVVLKREVYGYIINRFQAALLREAIDLVDREVATVEDIDKAFRAGPGIRSAIMGPYLRAHLAGGSGGIEYFIKTLLPTYSYRWKDMATWTAVPQSSIKKIIQGTKGMKMVEEHNFKELCKWRDKNLVKLLKIIKLNNQ